VVRQLLGGAGDRRRAGHYLRVAGERALAQLAFDRAARLFEMALERESDAATKRKLLVLMGDALASDVRPAEAAEKFLAAAAQTNDREQKLVLKRRAAEQLLRSSRYADGVAVLRQVLAAFGLRIPKTPREAIRSLLWRRTQLRLRGTSYRARTEAQIASEELLRIDTCWAASIGLGPRAPLLGAYFQALGLLLALRAGEPKRVAQSLATEALFSSVSSVSPQRVARLLAQAEQIANESDHAYAIGLAASAGGVAAYNDGRFAEAIDCFTRAEQVFRERCDGINWEISTLRVFRLDPLYARGDLAALQREAWAALGEARERNDPFFCAEFRSGTSVFAWLAADDLHGAREAVGLARRSLDGELSMQHYHCLFADTQADLYAGEWSAACDRIEQHFNVIAGSHLMRIHLVRRSMLELRARANLAAGRGDPTRLAIAERAAKAWAREAAPWCAPSAAVIQAGLAAARGQQARALADLERAAKKLDELGRTLYAAAARHALGRLRSGDEGRALITEAERAIADHGAKNPTRLATMLAPGFGE
jgi:hypothetical protein